MHLFTIQTALALPTIRIHSNSNAITYRAPTHTTGSEVTQTLEHLVRSTKRGLDPHRELYPLAWGPATLLGSQISWDANVSHGLKVICSAWADLMQN